MTRTTRSIRAITPVTTVVAILTIRRLNDMAIRNIFKVTAMQNLEHIDFCTIYRRCFGALTLNPKPENVGLSSEQEPLWAALAAVLYLGDVFTIGDCIGGV